MNNKNQLGFIHKFISSDKKLAPTLLLLHGTGGNEDDLIPVGRNLASDAAILSPRGKVLENGIYPRFFRRLAEGVFDTEDLKFRAHELADFVEKAADLYDFDLNHLIVVGYSNGANMAASLLLLRPAVISSAILFRPMVPLIPKILPDLSIKYAFISAGLHDPIILRQRTEDLISLLKESGAIVSINWQNSGHELATEEISKAKNWLSSLVLVKK